MVYIIFFSFLIICSFIKGKARIVLFVETLFLFLIIGLRDLSVGADTYSYVQDFIDYSRKDWSSILQMAVNDKEPLYVILSWLPSRFSNEYTSFLLLWALFPAISLYIVFSKELSGTKDYLIAFIVFFVLGLFAFFVAGIRQTAALSLLLVGFRYLSRVPSDSIKSYFTSLNLYKFLCVVAIAYLIHNSSVIFLVSLPFLYVNVFWYPFIFIALFYFAKFVQLDQIISLSSFFFGERFNTYSLVESSQSETAFYLQLILFFVCFINRNKLIKSNIQNKYLFNLLVIGLIFQSMSGLLAEMFRISFYFCMFAIILVPRSLMMFTGVKRIVVYSLFVIACLIYLFLIAGSSLPEYQTSIKMI